MGTCGDCGGGGKVFRTDPRSLESGSSLAPVQQDWTCINCGGTGKLPYKRAKVACIDIESLIAKSLREAEDEA